MRRLLAAAALVVLTVSCTPGEAIWVAFHRHGNHVVDQANRIAWCESRHDPNAVSHTNDHGLFQLNAVHARSHPDLWWNRYDAMSNAMMAERLYAQQGWQPWVCRHAAD